MSRSALSILGTLLGVCWALPGWADVNICDQPAVPIDTNPPTEAVIEVLASEIIVDTRVVVDITHGFIGDVTIDLESPEGTLVRLHDEIGGGDEDIFLTYADDGYPNGSVSFDLGCFVQPSGPGALADFTGEDTQGEWFLFVVDVFAGGASGTLNEWCLQTYDVGAPTPNVSVENLSCSSVGGTGVADLTWTNPVAFDNIEIFLEGTLIDLLPGTATSYSVPAQAFPDTVEICVRGTVNGIPGCVDACCNVTLPLLPADLVACSDPDVVIPYPGPAIPDVIDVTVDQGISDTQISVDIAHTFVGDLVIDIEHDGTSVRLQDETGGADDDMILTYWDLGVPNNSQPYNCGCLMQATGPGLLAEFTGGSTLGAWTLIVEDVFDGQHPNGTFNSWCLLSYENASVNNLACDSASGSGVVDLTWSNPSLYSAINVYVNDVLETTLVGTATSYSTSPQTVPSTVSVCVEPISGPVTFAQVCCEIDVIVDPVQDLDCVAVSGSGVADATWTLPTANYEAINVFVGGVQEATLPATATSYTTLPQTPPVSLEIGIQGVQNGLLAELISCNVAILDLADIEECDSPGTLIDEGTSFTETIDIVDSTVIGDVEALVVITHPFIGDLIVDLSSPGGSTIRLHDLLGDDSDDINVLYTDMGIPNAVPYDCGCFMQPSGPGLFADFVGELSDGAWGLFVEDIYPFPSPDGTLDQWCVRITEGCQVLPPNNLTCTTGGPDITLSWSNDDTYDEIDVVRDGLTIATLAGGDTSYLDTTAPPGIRTYRVIGLSFAQNCGNASNECVSALGITDVIFRGEQPDGFVDSVAALETALEGSGRVVLVVDDLTSDAVNFGGAPEILWACLGTYPNEHDLTAAEGVFLAEMITGDLGLNGSQDQPPTPVYIEGADVWGFSAQTAFEDYDGVENASFGNIEDGDDSLVFLEGADSGFGLDVSSFGGPYTQDTADPDFTDRLIPCDVNPDLGGPNSGVAWTTLDAQGNSYNIGTYYGSSVAPVIAQSWEIGGFQGNLVQLVSDYVTALLTTPPPPMDTFIRGDANGDGSFSGLIDGLFVLNFQFVAGSPGPPCMSAADADDSGTFSGLVDGLFILNFQFVAGSSPPPPPGASNCGLDPTPDALTCDDHPCP